MHCLCVIFFHFADPMDKFAFEHVFAICAIRCEEHVQNVLFKRRLFAFACGEPGHFLVVDFFVLRSRFFQIHEELLRLVAGAVCVERHGAVEISCRVAYVCGELGIYIIHRCVVLVVLRFDLVHRCAKLGRINIIIGSAADGLRICIEQRAVHHFGQIPRRCEIHVIVGDGFVFVGHQEFVVVIFVAVVLDSRKLIAARRRTGCIVVEVFPFRLPKSRTRRRAELDIFRNGTVRPRRSAIDVGVCRIDILMFAVHNAHQRARRRLRGVECDGSGKFVCLDFFPCRRRIRGGVVVVELGTVPSRVVNAVVVVTSDRVLIALQFRVGFFGVVVRGIRVIVQIAFRTDTVDDEGTEVHVRIGGVVVEVVGRLVIGFVFIRRLLCVFVDFFHVRLIEVVLSATRYSVRSFLCIDGCRRVCSYGINLIIGRSRALTAVDVVGNAHRVVDGGVDGVLLIVIESACALGEHGRLLRVGIEGFEHTVLFIETVHHAVHFYETEVGGVGGKTEVVPLHRLRTVKPRALEVDPRIFHLTLDILIRRGGCVVHVIAKDVDTRFKVLRTDEGGHDDFCTVVLACRKVGLGDAHQRAFHDVAVLVVRGVAFLPVDEVHVVALFHGETAVGRNDGVRCRRVKLFAQAVIAASGHRKRRSKHRSRSYETE